LIWNIPYRSVGVAGLTVDNNVNNLILLFHIYELTQFFVIDICNIANILQYNIEQ